MNRRHFLMVFGVGALAGASAFASTFEDAVVAQLTSQGYKSITVERTLLGRVKIVGLLDTGRREIILNPRTGEILRDLWMVNAGGPIVPKIRDKSDTSGKGGDDGGGDTDGGGSGDGSGDDGGSGDNSGSGGDSGGDGSGDNSGGGDNSGPGSNSGSGDTSGGGDTSSGGGDDGDKDED